MAEQQMSFAEWVTLDQQWKTQTTQTLMQHGERLSALETVEKRAANAESSAVVAKRWGQVGVALMGLLNGMWLVFGGSK